MYIFLPNAKDGLPTLEEKHFNCSESGFLDRHTPRHCEVLSELRIPKFKFSFGSEALKGLGLVSPVSPGLLTEMVDKSPPDVQKPYVTIAFNKSYIEVNEGGTEAAAAFGVFVGEHDSPGKVIDFVADHPFLFLVREDVTGVVLFSGHVLNSINSLVSSFTSIKISCFRDIVQSHIPAEKRERRTYTLDCVSFR